MGVVIDPRTRFLISFNVMGWLSGIRESLLCGLTPSNKVEVKVEGEVMKIHYVFVDKDLVAYADIEVEETATIALPPENSALTDVDLANLEEKGIVIDFSKLEQGPGQP